MAVTLGEAQSPVLGVVFVDVNLGLSHELGPESLEEVTWGFEQIPEVVSCSKSATGRQAFTLRLAAYGLGDELRERIIRKAEHLVQTAV